MTLKEDICEEVRAADSWITKLREKYPDVDENVLLAAKIGFITGALQAAGASHSIEWVRTV